MTAPGEAVTHLPWLAPCAASLVSLARPGTSTWDAVRADPGAVLLLVRAAGDAIPPARLPAALHNPAVLNLALRHLDQPESIDWNRADVRPVYDVALVGAHRAAQLALQTGRADADAAWIAALLAPLGWLAACAPDGAAQACRTDAELARDPIATQRRHWGLDAIAIARRLARRWELPGWLSALVGNLNLNADLAGNLGTDRDLLAIVQVALALAQEQHGSLGLAPGIDVVALAGMLGLTEADLATVRSAPIDARPREWAAPATTPLLRDLLLIAAENRALAEAPALGRVEADCDKLHDALAQQNANELQRLRAQNLAALAEFAAGAGHEINNPLAVISGQAQYILRYLSNHHEPVEVSEDEEADPQPPPAVAKSLQKIIGQTQRINDLLNQLMQFARPARPKKARLDVNTLVRDSAGELTDLAEQRRVRLVCPEVEPTLALLADARQLRLALTGLLRNAVEAAPPEGWAGIRVSATHADWVDLVIEDSGPGPNAQQRLHMFDPFYSGRQAGRGKGLGLPAAWRIAREHGGDVLFDEQCTSPTRFTLRLPRPNPPLNGSADHPAGHHALPNGVNGHVAENVAAE